MILVNTYHLRPFTHKTDADGIINTIRQLNHTNIILKQLIVPHRSKYGQTVASKNVRHIDVDKAIAHYQRLIKEDKYPKYHYNYRRRIRVLRQAKEYARNERAKMAAGKTTNRVTGD